MTGAAAVTPAAGLAALVRGATLAAAGAAAAGAALAARALAGLLARLCVRTVLAGVSARAI